MSRETAALVREFTAIRSSFRRLARSFGRIGPLLSTVNEVASPDAENGARIRRRPRLTATQRSALKLQGKYMGTMRGLKPGQRAQIKKIRASKGIHAAIAAAQKLAG